MAYNLPKAGSVIADMIDWEHFALIIDPKNADKLITLSYAVDNFEFSGNPTILSTVIYAWHNDELVLAEVSATGYKILWNFGRG